MRRINNLLIITLILFMSGCSSTEILKRRIDLLQENIEETREVVEGVTIALEVVARQYGEGVIQMPEKTFEVVEKGVELGKKAGVNLEKAEDVVNEIDDAIPEKGEWDFSAIAKLLGAIVGIGLSLTGRNVETMES